MKPKSDFYTMNHAYVYMVHFIYFKTTLHYQKINVEITAMWSER